MCNKNQHPTRSPRMTTSTTHHAKNLMLKPDIISLYFVALLAVVVIIPIEGQEALNFGYQVLPEKILENTDVILQVYSMSGEFMLPRDISNLKAVSSDSEIIQILGVEQTGRYTTNLKIKAIKAGTANIAIAAQGFASQEIPITVYTNNNNPSKLSLKLTPDDFAVDSPKFGYVAVELLTSGGLPTRAINDTTITLLSPNSDVVELVDDKLVIPKGKYFAMGQFKVKDSGDAIIFAETEGMKKVSGKVRVREVAEPLTLKLYANPQQYLSLTNNIGYAVVQLEDGEGIPVKATRDITVKIAVDNPEATVNASTDREEISFAQNSLTIKEGTYSAYTSFLPRPDFSALTGSGSGGSSGSSGSISKTFNIQISSEGYATSGSSITVVHDTGVGELNGNGPAKIAPIPFLATGGTEIMGVAYLETQISVSKIDSTGKSFMSTLTVPVMPTERFVMKASSSDLKAVSIIDPIFERGKNAALIFGNTGTVIPDSSVIVTYEDNEGIKTATASPKGPVKDDLSLTAEPLIDEILVDEEFPVLAFMKASKEEEAATTETTGGDEEEEDSREGPTRFISDTVIVFEANDIINVDAQSVKQNQPYLLFSPKTNDVGTTTLSGAGGGFDVSMTVTSKTTDPTDLQMSYIGITLPATESLATIQLLDSAGNPVFVSKDTEIKLISDGDNIIEIPDAVTIKAGEYYTTFTIKGIADGTANISTLSENFPLKQFEVEIKSLQPTLTLTGPESVYQGNDLTADLSISFAGTDVPISGYAVEWDAQGAETIRMDSVTSEEGLAKIVLKALDAGSITITATVTGPGVSSAVATKQITVNPSLAPIVDETPQQTGIIGISIGGIDIMYLIIPAAAGGAIFFLKKTNRLEGILEKIKLDGLIETIKEKIPSRE
ncbi:MAG: hypothetical protein WAO91_06505 [Candidatus Nitrosotenuis sp.]